MERFIETVEKLEWALILNTPVQNVSSQLEQDAFDIGLASTVINGQYKQSLTCAVAREILGIELLNDDQDIKTFVETLDISSYVSTRIKSYLSFDHDSFQELIKKQQIIKQLYLLCVSVASLNAFVQTCWTGPVFDLEPQDILPAAIRERYSVAELNRKVHEILSVDGEDVYHLTPRALYLLIPRIILVENSSLFTYLKSIHWWGQRVLFIQQRILDNVSGSLHDTMLQYLQSSSDALPSLIPEEKTTEIYTRFHLEYGIINHFYGHDSLAKEHFTKAQELSGFKWMLTGMLGKRTKFQTFDVSQLLVVANSQDVEFKRDDDLESSGIKNVPNALSLNDDTLLEKVEISEIINNDKNGLNSKSNLKIIDQCLLLAFCLNVKNTNPSHGITTEQMMPFVSRVLENPNNWMVYTMALLLRSRLEKEKSRTVERSVLQLQALVDQFPLELSSAKERLNYFYQILLPSKWEMEKELALQYLSLGVVQSALQIFERLEMWEDIINCYIMLEKEFKAKGIILERLNVTPNSPKLYCLLGDVEKNPKRWEHAWDISGNRYGRAMRSLGAYWFKQKEYRKSIECYTKALNVNPIFENAWFVQGCAAMHVEEWDISLQAFSRAIAIDPDNSEAWNNLASVFLKQGRKVDAFNAFQQGLKQKYDSWRIWTNYMYTAVDIGEFSETIRAMQRVVDLRWEKEKESCIDLDVLEILVNAITQGILDANKNSASRLAPRLENLLTETITSRMTSHPRIWQLCAQFWFWKKEYDKALESHLRAYRCILHNPRLETSEDIFKQAANTAIEVVEAYQNLGDLTIVHKNSKEKMTSEDSQTEVSTTLVCKDWKYQAKSLLTSLIGKTKNFEGTEMHDKLKETLKELKSL
ncbi:10089_t:CDS:1 [Dentiscutata erythropus]|uniref:10089_t:CDS:1 n=1 Tax=Dentiscutata erythropus TaxID=1348616 RepID=A0A9N9FRT5_9GLOM|nr:10089_t:CDS:1 [Dentiscutata erythropus]